MIPLREKLAARAVLSLFTLSGLCSLIYQVVWTRWLGLILGNFSTAVATTVAVFMAGLALGNALSGRFSSRLSARRAILLYAALECGLAALASLSPVLFAASSAIYPGLAAISPAPILRALVCAGLLLPPTILMGATLPALVRALSASAPGALGPLYSLNTLGGALGPLLAAFVLMPALGLRLTVWATAALNLAIAAAAWRIAESFSGEEGAPAQGETGGNGGTEPPGWPDWIPYVLAMASGFVALAFEIALTRLFILTVTGGSVYGFAVILSAFLLGIALGAALLKRRPPQGPQEALLACAAALAVAWLFSLTTPFWDILPPLLVRVWWLPIPFGTVTLFNFMVVTALLLALTTASGYSLPALASALRFPGPSSIGRLFAANTVGGVAGALATGLIVLPALGLFRTLLGLGGLALLVSASAAATALPRLRLAAPPAAAALVALAFFLLPPPNPDTTNSGMYNRPVLFKPGAGLVGNDPAERARSMGKILYERDSMTGHVAVRIGYGGIMAFVINGKTDGSQLVSDVLTQILPAHLTALTNPAARNALVIGLGSGTTAGSLTLYPGLQKITVVEIEEALLDVAQIFRDYNQNVMNNRRVNIVIDDARHHLVTTRESYDIIASEVSNIFLSGMVNLYTDDFYRLVRAHLNPGGAFVQFFHYYQVGPEDLRGMLATFISVFPHAIFWMHENGDGFLLAKPEDFAIDFAGWKKRLGTKELAGDLRRVEVSPPIKMLGFMLWGPGDVERFSRGARICTDDNPYFEFTTPRVRYVRAALSDLCIRMQLYGPLEPVPLVRESPRVRAELGEMFLERGNLVRAMTEYRRAAYLDPSSAGLMLKTAYIQWDLLSRKEEAEKTLLALLKRQPSNAEALKKLREVRAGRPPLSENHAPETPADSYGQ